MMTFKLKITSKDKVTALRISVFAFGIPNNTKTTLKTKPTTH